jgi:PhnB protein
MATVNPYLIFSKECEEAFNFYKAAFGGEFSGVMRFKDMPGPYSEAEGNKIMHMALPIGDTILMGSDNAEAMGSISQGNNFSVSIQAASDEEADKIYNSLSAGGKITMKLGKAPWNAYFGMFIDKFGIHWLINHDYTQDK